MISFEERESDYFDNQARMFADIVAAVRAGDSIAVHRILEDTKHRAHAIFNPQCHGNQHVDCYQTRQALKDGE